MCLLPWKNVRAPSYGPVKPPMAFILIRYTFHGYIDPLFMAHFKISNSTFGDMFFNPSFSLDLISHALKKNEQFQRESPLSRARQKISVPTSTFLGL